MNLIALSAFIDNYIWMLHDGRQAIIVDPGKAAPVIEALTRHRLSLAGILVTHHHDDHVGGLVELQAEFKSPIFAPAREPMPVPVTKVNGGDAFELLGCRFEVLDIPGHTAGHIAFFHQPETLPPLLFCGDTLFSGGCGRLFEGTPVQMYESLRMLAALPASTRVCCGHEYTLDNLRFAQTVENDNPELVRYAQHCQTLRSQRLPTLPSTIGQERLINPFLRCAEPAVVQATLAHGANGSEEIEVFTALRQWKNTF